MTVSNGYCTDQDIRDQIGDSGAKLDTDQIDRAINAASRAIDRYCGRRFWADTELQVRTYRPDDRCSLYVDDISTSMGLVLKTDTSLDGTFATTWDTADFQLEPLGADQRTTAFSWYQVVAVGSKFFPCDSRRATVQLTAKFGWSEIPDEVVEACILKATGLFRRKDAPFGVAGVNDFGPVRIARKDHDVMELLAPFILPAVS